MVTRALLKLPVFDAGGGLKHLLLDSNISSTSFSDFVKIYKGCSTNELNQYTWQRDLISKKENMQQKPFS
jgi:hypothetical protein